MATNVQCPRCFGRGYTPEARKPSSRNPLGLGFYARTCPRCQGSGTVVEKQKTSRGREPLTDELRAALAREHHQL